MNLPTRRFIFWNLPAEMIAVIRKFHVGMRAGPHGRRGAIGLVPGHAGAATGVLDVATAVQRLLRRSSRGHCHTAQPG